MASATDLVARESELGAIQGLLEDDGPLLRALVLEGEPGVGKTSLWEWGIADARRRGMRVLVARASQAEAGLPFAALVDLLDEVGTEELAAVPPPQLRALTVALYRADPTDRAPAPEVIPLGLLSALRALAGQARLLVAVDDVQWLDRSSEEALAHAVRRLQSERVTLLLARRPGRRSSLEKALPDDRVQRVVVTATSIGATRQILATRLGLRLPHHLLRRVYVTTLGNPLFALEVGRLLAGRDLATLGDDLPVPEDVEDLLGLRVADLDIPARRVLLALALDADLRAGQLRDVAGSGALQSAVDAGVVVLEGERARASHPLVAEAAKRQATTDERRDLHRDIAGALAGVDAAEQRRALHLALATEIADEELSALIADAAEVAAVRGETRLAVDLGMHSLRLTPADSRTSADRVLALAEHLSVAGEKQRVTDLLTDRLEELPAGAPRVTAYLLLTSGMVEDNDDIVALLERALLEAGDDPGLRAPVLAHLSVNEAVIEVRAIERSEQRAQEAVASGGQGRLEDQRLALDALAWARALRGRAVGALSERHDALSPDRPSLARSPERVAGQQLVWRGEVHAARAVLTAYRALAEERAEPAPYALGRLHLCELELRVGHWDEAERLLDDWAASNDSSLLLWPMYERCRALLATGRGDVKAARRWGGQALELAESTGVRWDWLEARRALGIAALLHKDFAEAVRHLGEVWEHTEREGVLDPGAFPVGPDLVEALVEHDSPLAADRVLQRLATLAGDQEHLWGLAGARRSRALLALAEHGYDDDAATSLDAAAASYQELGLAFDEARTLLVLGRAQRRARKWGASRDVLERAVAAFENLGSPGWAEDARAELGRVGARRPTAGTLTVTERRVARLAADGLANKEIARTLVVTVNTVEFHLRNTYAKLGIRSRAQLGSRLLEEEPGPRD